MRIKRLFGIAIGLAILASPFLLAWQRQNLADWWRLRAYDPPVMIASLADNTTMNDLGRKLFYVHKPLLQDKANFNGSCPTSEQTIILGCYITHSHIYLYDVTDERLSGIEEVTAAHEMLHAAYDRLSSDERQRVDNMTAQAYAALNSQRITKTVEAYRERDSSVVNNELHSILATEVRDLSSDLELYYGRYFNDRKKIVEYSEKYEAEFESREKAIADYDQQLAELKIQTDGLKVELSLQSDALAAQQQQLMILRNSDPAAYNEEVPSYNAQVQDYNADLAKLKNLIADYNDIVAKRNQIASEEQELIDAINSNFETLP